ATSHHQHDRPMSVSSSKWITPCLMPSPTPTGLRCEFLQTARGIDGKMIFQVRKRNRESMHQQRFGARATYRQEEDQRVKESVSLAEKFTALKSLKVDLTHFAPEGDAKTSEIKYMVNLQNAKSVFRFNCP